MIVQFLVAAAWSCSGQGAPGNRQPVRLVRLVRPPAAPLSPLAQIGRAMFFDARLSASGAMSCASCHDPAFAYGPPDGRPAPLGGVSGNQEGMRAVPSLRYVDRSPAFAIGPDLDEDTPPTLPRFASLITARGRPRKIAGAAAKPALVPRGGLFWDGRADSLQTQAAGPLLNQAEMANRDAPTLSRKFVALGYGDQLARALGLPADQHVPEGRLFDEGLFAIARFEFEDASFHP